jgi:hypothetical protein
MKIWNNMITGFLDFIINHFLFLKFISLLISSVLIGFTIYFIIKLNLIGGRIEHYGDVLSSKGMTRRRGVKGWGRILKRLKSADESEFKIAVLEADRILNDILKLGGYPGINLNERLAGMTSANLSNLEEIRQVHKLHERIISDPDFSITQNEARVAIEIYKKAFQELQLID